MPASKNLTGMPDNAYEPTITDEKRAAEERALGMIDPGHPSLNDVAHPVVPDHIQATQIQQVIARLFETAKGQRNAHQRSKANRTLVGLAAPQIGEPLCIVLIDTAITPDRKGRGRLECFINPEIVWRSRETEEGREGCFSAGPVWGLVRRPIAIKIRAFDAQGRRVERVFENFTARIAQHEIDHLSGIRFADRITVERKRHWVHVEEMQQYKQEYRTWKRICTLERWEAFKKYGHQKAASPEHASAV